MFSTCSAGCFSTYLQGVSGKLNRQTPWFSRAVFGTWYGWHRLTYPGLVALKFSAVSHVMGIFTVSVSLAIFWVSDGFGWHGVLSNVCCKDRVIVIPISLSNC